MQVLDFRVSSSRLGSTAIVAISGALDMHAANRVADKFHDALFDEDCSVVVDLLETTVVDSVGLGVLAAAARLARSTGAMFVLAADDPLILRILQLTGLDRLFEIEPTLTKAIERVVERTLATV